MTGNNPNLSSFIMYVKNINGTAERSCKCDPWINLWRNFSGQTATICRAKGCSRKDIAGARVKKCFSDDEKEYVVPFCNYHHQQQNICIELVAGTILTPANKKLTYK
jgi:hypothetical protein